MAALRFGNAFNTVSSLTTKTLDYSIGALPVLVGSSLFVLAAHTQGIPTTPTDNQGNIYTLLGSNTVAGFWVTTSTQNIDTQITVNSPNGVAGQFVIAISEITGLNLNAFISTGQGFAATGPICQHGTFTILDSHDVLFLACATFDHGDSGPMTFAPIICPAPNLIGAFGGQAAGYLTFRNGAGGILLGSTTEIGTFAASQNLQPVFGFYALYGILVSCNNPPRGTLNVPYSTDGQPFFGSNGTAPYTFAITVGALPNGLVLNGATGVVSGTPTKMGIFIFTIQATDSKGMIATTQCSITIGKIGNFTPQRTIPLPSPNCCDEPCMAMSISKIWYLFKE